MGMKPVIDRQAGLSQGIAQVRLHADQSRQIGAGDTRPQHARAPDIRKGADALRGEAKALISRDDWCERRRQLLDIGARKVAEEMERQMDAIDGIDPN